MSDRYGDETGESCPACGGLASACRLTTHGCYPIPRPLTDAECDPGFDPAEFRATPLIPDVEPWPSEAEQNEAATHGAISTLARLHPDFLTEAALAWLKEAY